MVNKILNSREETLLSTLRTILGNQQWCLYLASEQNIEKFGGLLPSLVIRDIRGVQILSIPIGQQDILTLGQSISTAIERIDAMNGALGLDCDDIEAIYESAGVRKLYNPAV